MTQKTNQNPWTMDVRVRERNLKSGALTDKDLEKYLGALPDVADQSEAFGTSQPALAQPQVVVSASSGVDDIDDESEEDDDDIEEAEQPAGDTGSSAGIDGEGGEP
ncbi:MAG: hypothetical protein KF764_24895 [Labilithrix sp.]|nr:hypothetical protein [Labilithrix sp.]MBX3220483.1 hypothetical protein [Labilithrix sp.]